MQKDISKKDASKGNTAPFATFGFSLIELLLVMAILLVIGTFSTVFFSRFMTQSAVANTQDQLIGQLRKAQLYAMMGKQNGSWGVEFAANTITLFQGSSFATRTTALDETFTKNANVTISGLNEVVFTKTTGVPSTTGTYTITGSSSTAQVTLNSLGVASR